MRTKNISLLLALVLVISAISLPLTAYAAGEKDTTPPELAASLDGGTLKIESSDDNSGVEAVFVDGNRINSLTNGVASVTLKDYAGTEKQVSVYAQDYAGNRSKTVKFDNPYYEEPAPKEKPAETVPQSQSSKPVKPAQDQAASSSTNHNAQSSNAGSHVSGNDSNTGTNTDANGGSNTASGTNGSDSNSQEETETTSSIPDGAFTPEGTGTVLDEAAGEGDDKQFYTITTEAGNVFYLIIDGKRDDNNVYFLNGVTEDDLMALAEKGDGSVSTIPEAETCTCTEKCEAGEVNISCPVCKNDLKSCTGKEKPDKDKDEESAEPEKPKKDTGSAGTMIFLIAALLAAGGVGYYVKIVRPKQQAEDDEDSLDDGYGEGFDPDEAYGEPEYFSEDDFDDRINHEHEDSE